MYKFQIESSFILFWELRLGKHRNALTCQLLLEIGVSECAGAVYLASEVASNLLASFHFKSFDNIPNRVKLQGSQQLARSDN